MMKLTHRDAFRKLLIEAFDPDRPWTEWFMNEVYDDDEVLTLEHEGKVDSVLLLTPYTMMFQGQELQASYISCVATARAQRGKGLMHKLMEKALRESFFRGDAFTALIPENRRLYFFYDHFDFATVFYADEHRYIQGHPFARDERFKAVEPTYELFERLEAQRPTGYRHDSEQFDRVLQDNRLDGGRVVAVSDGEGSEAMAFATFGRETHVRDILATDIDAYNAALSLLPTDKSYIVWTEPSELPNSPVLRSRGMIRIVNVEKVLGALAAENPDTNQLIRVSDGIIADNNGTFHLHNGYCARVEDPVTPGKNHLEVHVYNLAKLLFSAPTIGEIFNLPTSRPTISLMME